MGRRSKNDGLDDFYEWLMFDRGLMPTSARVYVSNARKVRDALQQKGAADQAAVDAVFDELSRDRASSLANYLVGWTALVEYVREKGATLPLPQMRTTGGRRLNGLPETVRQALRDLKALRYVPLSLVPHLRWAHVNTTGMSTGAIMLMVTHPGRRNESMLIPTEIIRALMEYAVPRTDGMTALVPCTPGGVEPYPHRAMLNEVNRYS
jgi:hypothetical protein